jgi:hypothetical protein
VPVTESSKRAFDKEGVVTERRGRKRRRRREGSINLSRLVPGGRV